MVCKHADILVRSYRGHQVHLVGHVNDNSFGDETEEMYEYLGKFSKGCRNEIGSIKYSHGTSFEGDWETDHVLLFLFPLHQMEWIETYSVQSSALPH